MFSYTSAQQQAMELLTSPAHHAMLFGGSRSGKSFVLCCALAIRALRVPGSRHAVIRRYCASARSTIGMDTMPKVLRCRFGRKLRWHFNKAENFFHFDNGSEIWLVGLDDGERADKILGKEFATIYFNECSELEYSSVQTALTRLAQNVPPLTNRVYYDCNPPGRNHWCYRVFMEKCDPVTGEKFPNPQDYAAMQMNPADNRINLPDNYIENTLANLPERQRRRFMLGEWSDDVDGALWKRDMIDSARVTEVPPLSRVVIGVDPAVTGGKESDCTGIIAAGMDYRGEFYVLADESMQSSPLLWVRKALVLAKKFHADCIVVEVNNGGDLLGTLFSREDDSVPIRQVRAFKDKFSRAEPVAAFYEKGIVHHAGNFIELEEQMCSFKSACRTASPDRMDALVWAVSELAGEKRAERFILV